MAQLNAYLKFNGKCKEAMEFYRDCFGGELTLQTVGESPMAAGMPTEMHTNILHSALKTNKFTLMASDMTSYDGYVHGNTVHLCLVCESKEEIETLFAKLLRGGRVERELISEFFGTFGEVVDKYGFSWMLQFDGK